MAQETIGEAVWSGNYWGRDGAIERARRDYESLWWFTSNPPPEVQDTRLVYMNALYSAFGSVYSTARRGNLFSLWRAVRILLQLRPLLLTYCERRNDDLRLSGLSADQKEMLGAMLIKFATIPIAGGPKFRIAALEHASAALLETQNNSRSHTAALAALTLARADCMIKGSGDRVRQHLRFAERQNMGVADVNQRARIFRSLAELWKEIGVEGRARELIVQAEAVPGISDDVRAKIAEVKKTI